jgi:hypothetical protein
MFYRFPCDEETYNIIPIASDTRKVLIGFFKRERSSDKTNIVTIKKAILDVGVYLWIERLL